MTKGKMDSDILKREVDYYKVSIEKNYNISYKNILSFDIKFKDGSYIYISLGYKDVPDWLNDDKSDRYESLLDLTSEDIIKTFKQFEKLEEEKYTFDINKKMHLGDFIRKVETIVKDDDKVNYIYFRIKEPSGEEFLDNEIYFVIRKEIRHDSIENVYRTEKLDIAFKTYIKDVINVLFSNIIYNTHNHKLEQKVKPFIPLLYTMSGNLLRKAVRKKSFNSIKMKDIIMALDGEKVFGKIDSNIVNLFETILKNYDISEIGIKDYYGDTLTPDKIFKILLAKSSSQIGEILERIC